MVIFYLAVMHEESGFCASKKSQEVCLVWKGAVKSKGRMDVRCHTLKDGKRRHDPYSELISLRMRENCHVSVIILI